MSRIPNKVIEIVTQGPQGPVGPTGPVQDTGSLLVTASVPNPVLPIIQFGKGDGSTFDINITPPASSLPPIVSPSDTGSFVTNIRNTSTGISFDKGDGTINSVDLTGLGYVNNVLFNFNPNPFADPAYPSIDNTLGVTIARGNLFYNFVSLPLSNLNYITTASYSDGAVKFLKSNFTSFSIDIEGFPYTGDAEITGSLEVVGSVSASTYYGDGSNLQGIITDPFPYVGDAEITGSLSVTDTTFLGGNLRMANGTIIGVLGGETLRLGKISGGGSVDIALGGSITVEQGFTINNTTGLEFGATAGRSPFACAF